MTLRECIIYDRYVCTYSIKDEILGMPKIVLLSVHFLFMKSRVYDSGIMMSVRRDDKKDLFKWEI